MLSIQYCRLQNRKLPRRQDIVSWAEQWNHLYRKANDMKCTDYGANLEFINKPSKSVNPEFAQSAPSTVIRGCVQRESIQTIPKLAEWLLMEQQINTTLPSAGNANTAFATYQYLDTDNPTPSPSPSPTSKLSDQQRGSKKFLEQRIEVTS